jgi:hypothetical protein
LDGILQGKCHLIDDRVPLFTGEFLETTASVGVESVKLPPRSPNLTGRHGSVLRRERLGGMLNYCIAPRRENR